MTMAARPMISVIINTYNYGRYVEKAVTSALGQDFPAEDFEVIVVDDGSTDDTSFMLAPYMERITYLAKANGGQASALNAGFKIAKGDIIAFLDSDDFWYPEKLKKITGEFGRSGDIDVVYHYMHIIDKDGAVIGELKETRGALRFEKWPLGRLLTGSMPFGPETSAISVRASCLRNIMPIPEDIDICADWYINLLLPFYSREYAMCRQLLGAYRLHSDNYWKNGHRTVEKTRKAIKITEITGHSLAVHMRALGYDVSVAEKMLKPIIGEETIILRKLEGKPIEAAKEAFRWKGLTAHSYKTVDNIIKKMHLVLYALLPARVYRFLYSRYENSILFKIKRRFK